VVLFDLIGRGLEAVGNSLADFTVGDGIERILNTVYRACERFPQIDR
jgi:hypothetical protein